jgi:osmotically-inducible protein OsmY
MTDRIDRRGARRGLLPLLLLAAASLPLGGCVAGLAASAAGAAARAATPDRAPVTEDRRAAARTACEARAAALGRVHIIDSVQNADGRVTVWGTVEDARERRSFECRFDGAVKEFKLRPIKAR